MSYFRPQFLSLTAYLFFGTLILLFPGVAFGMQVTPEPLAPSTINEGESITIWYTVSGIYGAQVQCLLTNSGGGFENVTYKIGDPRIIRTYSPLVNTVYSADCSGDTGSLAVTVIPRVRAGAPVVTIAADNTSITYGSSTTIRYTIPNNDAVRCLGTGGTMNWEGQDLAPMSSSVVVSPSDTIEFRIECWNADLVSSGVKPVTINVSGTPSRQPTIYFSEQVVQPGGMTILTWKAGDPTDTYCIATPNGYPGWTGEIASAGSMEVTPSETTNFSILCGVPDFKPERYNTATVTVSYAKPRILSFSSKPDSLSASGEVKLYWMTENVKHCTGSWDPRGEPLAVNGMMGLPVFVSKTMNFTLTCFGFGGDFISSTLTVNVAGTTPGPKPGPGPSPIAPPSPSADSPSLIPCGRNIDNKNTTDIDETKPCTLCHIVLGGQGLISWGLKIMAVIAITVIFAMGVLYILSAGNSGMMETAKGGMIASLIGFAVMLSAYLIVNVVLTILVDTASPDKPFLNLTATQGYFNFACDITSNVNGK